MKRELMAWFEGYDIDISDMAEELIKAVLLERITREEMEAVLATKDNATEAQRVWDAAYNRVEKAIDALEAYAVAKEEGHERWKREHPFVPSDPEDPFSRGTTPEQCDACGKSEMEHGGDR